MWRLLLQAGLGAATLNVGMRIARIKRLAVAFAIAGVLGLLGLGGLLAALAIYLEPHFGAAGAAAIVGGGALVLAALVAWIGSMKPRVVRPTATPIAARVKSELSAVPSALAPSGTALGAGGSSRNRGLNIVLIAALAGIVLGRRL